MAKAAVEETTTYLLTLELTAEELALLRAMMQNTWADETNVEVSLRETIFNACNKFNL